MTNINISPFCEKTVKTRDKAMCCDLCSNWIHIKCNNLNDLDYEYLKSNDETSYCKTCIHEILPFCNKKINPNKINLGNAGIDLNLKNLLCQLNDLSEKENNDNENLPNCKYRDVGYFSNLYVELKSKCLSFFHLNINSLSKNFDNFNHLINESKLDFDIFGISESKFLKSQPLNTNVSLQNYIIEQTSTESTAGGAFLCINKRYSYKTLPKFAIYKPKKLESVLVEVVLPKKSHLILGCIYEHPCMDICTFNDRYLNPLLDNLSKESDKIIVLSGYFNIDDLLNFDTSEHVSTFLDDVASNSLAIRISNNGKTLIHNIFCNISNPLVKSAMSGNISSSISDHLPPFFILAVFFSNSSSTKYNIIPHEWEKFNNQSFLEDFEKINWKQILQSNKENVSITFENYPNTMNTVINSHAPLKKKLRKFHEKPWITKGIQNAIEKKNRVFKKYIKCGNYNKNIFHQEYKLYRKSLSTLLKQSKKSYYNDYFRNNINNIKNIWKGTKSIIFLNIKESNLLNNF